MSAIVSRVATGRVRQAGEPQSRQVARLPLLRDHALLFTIIGLSMFGLVMIASASLAYAEQNYGTPFYFMNRQLAFLLIGLIVGVTAFQLRLEQWQRLGPVLMVASLILLLLVLIPGIGKTVNGSRRWIDLGVFTVQVSEIAKLFMIVYLAGYLVRRGEGLRDDVANFLRPLVLIVLASLLLLIEPDFGASVVITATALAMFFMAGVRRMHFLMIASLMMISAILLIISSPYRMRRFASFLEPFNDPFDSGFQLTQSLIAIGSGGVGGLGLGNSVQKLFYLPEAHTDFLFAVLAEELGLIGVAILLAAYGFIVFKSFRLARDASRAGNEFGSHLALGIGVWIGTQAAINLGVNMGLLPTKGITLPMMSYGGSSAVVFIVGFALLLRVEAELRWQRLQMIGTQKPLSSGRELEADALGREAPKDDRSIARRALQKIPSARAARGGKTQTAARKGLKVISLGRKDELAAPASKARSRKTSKKTSTSAARKPAARRQRKTPV